MAVHILYYKVKSSEEGIRDTPSCAFYLHEINKHKILFHPLRISKLCEFNSNKFETKANLQLYVKLQTSSCNRLDRNGPVNFAMLN